MLMLLLKACTILLGIIHKLPEIASLGVIILIAGVIAIT